jgi:hypothetical protein
MEFEKLLDKITIDELRDFMLLYSIKAPEFKAEFELYFARKDEKIDISKRYGEWIRKTIRKYEHTGFIDYRGSSALASDLDNIINTGFVLAEKHNFQDAFTLTKVALPEIVQILAYCDDSSGNIGSTVEFCIQLLEQIANDPNAGNPLKELLFFYLETQLKEDVYFDYGDFGYKLLDIFESLAVKLSHAEVFLKHLNIQLSKPAQAYSDYTKNFYQVRKIEFLTAIGRLDEAQESVQQNLNIVEVRQGVVNEAISEHKYIQAKELIRDGIEIAAKNNHPGTIAHWQKELLRIAFFEKDEETIRHYSKHFAFDRGFNIEYYRIWKNTYLSVNWKDVIELHIQQSIDAAADVYELNKKRGWQEQSMLSLLSAVASIYIEERYLDRLMALVKKEKALDRILYYHDVLIDNYRSDLLNVYLPAIMVAAAKVNDRNQYKNLVNQMKKIINDIPEGKKQMSDLAKELSTTYWRRRAMVEELTKFIQLTTF